MKTYRYDYPHPAVAVDIAVFTLIEGRLSVLLIRRGLDPFAGEFALPGGFVLEDETVEAAAARELEEETGVIGGALEHVGIYSKPDRDPRERVISVAYLAAVEMSAVRLQAASDAAEAEWFDAVNPPPLAFDHKDILADALTRLRSLTLSSGLAIQMLAEPFTLSDLQQASELIVGRELDKRNFRRQTLESDWLEETGDFTKGMHRPAKLYRRIRSW